MHNCTSIIISNTSLVANQASRKPSLKSSMKTTCNGPTGLNLKNGSRCNIDCTLRPLQ